ncbi:DEAD/DEAH box helicase-like [Frankia canadensis]|uniref:RNA helicase n=1 Tax=Frankia canadensis TaxID=1836972 RepID=A0A2I2KJP8_9ACTN|nr:DEAD/DEAH box helicase-like [Frankia canadensis]SOU53180.1 DEAD/DEAH box helicase-like [Frankia canadensis]
MHPELPFSAPGTRTSGRGRLAAHRERVQRRHRSEKTRSVPLSVTAAVPSDDLAAPNKPIETAAPTERPTFADLGVRAETVEALAEAGIIHAFPIQELTLPLALGRNDIIGQARTGTGKTLAFGIPVVQTALAPGEGADGRPQALVVVPTRELCVQVTADVTRAGARRGLRVISVYGGRAYEPQLTALRAGVDVVVGTPGRLLDLARQKVLDLAGVRTLVLDEADEMLDLGFLPDVERIMAQLPTARQTMLFSATMPGPVISLARRFMQRPVHVRAEQPDETRTVPTTHQHVFRAHALDKMEVLARVLQATGRGLAMVFVRTRRTADKVAEELDKRGFAAAAVHGDLGQGQREQALRAFRAGKVDVLVATDVAARGIDISGVTHVVNYQCPEDENVYLHRIGRTGRAGESGVAVTFVDWDDLPRWTLVNKALGLPFDGPVETYSTSPHLYEALEIPAEAAGTLPHAARTRAGLDAEDIEDLGESRRGRRGPRAGRETSRAADRPVPTRTRTRRRTRGAGAAAAASGLAIAAEDAAENDVTDLTTDAVGVVAEANGVADADGPDAAVSTLASEAGGAAGEPARRRRRRRGNRGRGTGAVRGEATDLADLAEFAEVDAGGAEAAPLRAESA